jgi:hypothetical protein
MNRDPIHNSTVARGGIGLSDYCTPMPSIVRKPLKTGWWRRRESNPRPKKPAVKRTTCVSDSVIVGRRIRTGKKTTA